MEDNRQPRICTPLHGPVGCLEFQDVHSDLGYQVAEEDCHREANAPWLVGDPRRDIGTPLLDLITQIDL